MSSVLQLIFTAFSLRRILISILLSFIGLYLHKKLQKNPKHVHFARSIPGPAALPIFGNSLLLLLHARESMTDIFDKYVTKYGCRFRIWMGKQLLVVLTDVEDIETVLQSSKMVDKPRLCDAFSEFYGDSLVFAPAHVWRHSRKIIQPFFSKNSLQCQIPIMSEMVCRQVDFMKMYADGPEFDLKETISDFYFDVIAKSYFNIELSDSEKKCLNFFENVDTSSEIGTLRVTRPWLRLKFLANILYGANFDSARIKCLNFARKILARNAWRAENVDRGEQLNSETFPVRLILAMLQDEDAQDINELAAHNVLVTTAAGTGTVGPTTSFFLLTIAIYPEIQDRLYSEIHKLYGQNDRAIEIHDLNKLPYLDQVLKEVQRRFTIVPSIYRTVDVDTKIGDLVYPAGTSLILSLSAIHFNPTLYPDPYSFNPDNFSPEAVSKRSKYSFLPFSAGPRNCIGRFFAEVVMKFLLIALLRSFSFHTTTKFEDISQQQGLVAISASGYRVSIKRRRGAESIDGTISIQN